MKKFIIAIALMLSCSMASAQTGISAGYLFQNMHESDGQSASSYNLDFHGFYAGVDYNIRIIGKTFAIVPGIYYEFLENKDLDPVKWQEHYLKIPVDFQLGFRIGKNARFIASIGPKFHIGLASKWKAGVESLDLYKFSENQYRRFDVLLGASIGIEVFNHMKIKVGYDRGLVNRNAAKDTKLYNNIVHAGLSFVF